MLFYLLFDLDKYHLSSHRSCGLLEISQIFIRILLFDMLQRKYSVKSANPSFETWTGRAVEAGYANGSANKRDFIDRLSIGTRKMERFLCHT